MTSTDEVSTSAIEAPIEDGRSPLRARRSVIAGTAAAVLMAAGGVALYAAAGDVPRGTTVLGVDLGAMSRAEAERTLHERFDARAGEPVGVLLDGGSVTVVPQDIAMTLDVAATVGNAVKGAPRLFGERDVAPVVRLDEAKLEALLRKHLDPQRITFRKTAITYDGVTPLPSYPKRGLDLDPAVAARAVRKAWLTGRPAEVGLTDRVPAMTNEQIDALVKGFATAAVAGPVTVTVDAKSFTLQPDAIAKGLVYRSDGAGLLIPAIDTGRLRAAAKGEFAKVETEPHEASISLAGGRPTIVASTAGAVVDMTKLGAELLRVLPDPGPRSVAASLMRLDPGSTDADMAKLGVKERVSTFTTYFTGGASSPRSKNIMTIAESVDGAIVKPGETFSLNGHTGERDYDAGYQDAPVIVDGKLEPGVGGGASQFTTTLSGRDRVDDLLPDARPQVQEHHAVRGPHRHLDHRQVGDRLDVEHEVLRQRQDRAQPAAQRHVTADGLPRARAGVHLQQRTPRFYPGCVAHHPQGWRRGEAREVHLALRSRATFHMWREAVARFLGRTG